MHEGIGTWLVVAFELRRVLDRISVCGSKTKPYLRLQQPSMQWRETKNVRLQFRSKTKTIL
jgi:hypothetical protein